MEQFANLASSTLASAYTAGSGSITLVSATGFPGSGTFSLAIRDQFTKAIKLIFRVTSVSGKTFTGASEGTDASANAGDLVDGTIMTAAALAQIKLDWATPATSYVPSLLTEDKGGFGGTLGNTKNEYLSVAANATATMLNYTGGQPGYISTIWIGISYSDAASVNLGTIKITVDGESVPAINCRMNLFFFSEYLYNTNNFGSRFIKGDQNNSNNVGMMCYYPIPFNSTIKVELTNGSGSSAITLFSEVTYVTGVTNAWPNTKKLWASTGTLTNQTVNTVCTLVNASGLSKGRLFGVYLSIDSAPNSASPATAPLEGNVKIYMDGAGSPTFESSGTEDFFHSSNYFEGTFTNSCFDYVGITFKAGVTWNAYRFFVNDPMLFQNALKVTWNAGDSTQVNFTGGVRLAYCVLYYTEG